MLSEQTLQEIQTVARNTEVQLSVLGAMFNGCERGTDLWEYLEQDAEKFPKKIQKLFWGDNFFDFPNKDPDYEYQDEPGGLYAIGEPVEVIEALLEAVEKNIGRRLRQLAR